MTIGDDWRRLLSHLTDEPVELLGRGIEGAVFRLRPGTVAKVWTSKPVVEVERMAKFYAEVAAAGPAIATPLIQAVLVIEGSTVSVERELPGRALHEQLDADAGALPSPVIDAVVACLAALRSVAPTPATRALSVLEEPGPFRTPGEDFQHALGELVRRRAAVSEPALAAVLPDIEVRLSALLGRLAELDAVPDSVVHGDLFGGNIHADAAGAPVAILDFGFLTTAGDPRFDAAVTAAIMNMYGAGAAMMARQLTFELARQLGYDPATLLMYRAAYAVATCTLFGTDLGEGHFRWCAGQLRDPQTVAALGL